MSVETIHMPKQTGRRFDHTGKVENGWRFESYAHTMNSNAIWNTACVSCGAPKKQALSQARKYRCRCSG